MQQTPLVILATVLKDSGEGWGTQNAEIRVDKVLKGAINAGVNLTVNSMAGTSCHFRLVQGKQYVLFANPAEQPGAILIGSCSNSFALESNQLLYEVLLRPQGRLIGKVELLLKSQDSAMKGIPGVQVIASSPGRSFASLTNGDGEFQFSNLPPGPYNLSLNSDRYVDDPTHRFPKDPPVVVEGSCGYHNLSAWPNGQVSGRVLDINGKSVKGVPVQAFIPSSVGSWDDSPHRVSVTNGNGFYRLSGLPPGRVQIAINGSPVKDELPWPPLALPIDLGLGKHQTGVNLQLKAARPSATLRIELLDDENLPVFGTSLKLNDSAGKIRFEFASSQVSNIFDAKVFLGETYIVDAIETRSQLQLKAPALHTQRFARSNPIRLDQPLTHLKLIFKPKAP